MFVYLFMLTYTLIHIYIYIDMFVYLFIHTYIHAHLSDLISIFQPTSTQFLGTLIFSRWSLPVGIHIFLSRLVKLLIPRAMVMFMEHWYLSQCELGGMYPPVNSDRYGTCHHVNMIFPGKPMFFFSPVSGPSHDLPRTSLVQP